MEGWTLHMWRCILGVEGARNPCKTVAWPFTFSRDGAKQSGPYISLLSPFPSPSLLSCTRMVVSHPRAQPMARELGPDSQLNGGSGTGDGSAPKGPQSTGHSGGGALLCFCCPPSSAELSRLPPVVAEPSRTQPSPAELLDAPAAAARVPPSERASE